MRPGRTRGQTKRGAQSRSMLCACSRAGPPPKGPRASATRAARRQAISARRWDSGSPRSASAPTSVTTTPRPTRSTPTRSAARCRPVSTWSTPPSTTATSAASGRWPWRCARAACRGSRSCSAPRADICPSISNVRTTCTRTSRRPGSNPECSSRKSSSTAATRSRRDSSMTRSSAAAGTWRSSASISTTCTIPKRNSARCRVRNSRGGCGRRSSRSSAPVPTGASPHTASPPGTASASSRRRRSTSLSPTCSPPRAMPEARHTISAPSSCPSTSRWTKPRSSPTRAGRR